MPDLPQAIEERVRAAMAAALGSEAGDADPMVRAAAQPKFGDFQANFAMALAKRLGRKPRDLAQPVVDHLAVDPLFARVELAGPGFINLTLTDAALAERLGAAAADPRLGVEPVAHPQRVVVDYSSPNVAKEMHVGHLRSTVIGDAIARVLEHLGHDVVRQNHIGDWGTQFGMLIEYLAEAPAGEAQTALADLTKLYQAAKARFDADPAFADRARERVVKLQGGDAETLAHWRRLVDASLTYFQSVYDRLGVGLTPADTRGESAYNDRLAGVVTGLEAQGMLVESRGASVVYPPGFVDRDGEPMPMIVRKSGGGYLYATTDLAAARYRVDELRADRIVYVTDARQSQHFAMVFAALRQAGWAGESVRLDHVVFGTVLGPDRKPFKTRSGETVKLVDLLDEAERRAEAVIAQKNPELPAAQRKAAGRAVGIGALKYADLSSDRVKDYVFDWDRMLALEGNTAPYLQNAYVRVRSIFRKGGLDYGAVGGGAIALAEPAERSLGVKLLLWPQVVRMVGDSLEPHRLCTYLYELASGYHQFYERCPVLTAPDESTRSSRLALSKLVAQTIAAGLGLLGIEVVEQM